MNNLSIEAQRRRRLITRALPLAAVALVAFIIGAAAGKQGSPESEAAERFSEAWAHQDFGAMYRELNDESRRAVSQEDFAVAYEKSAEVSTLDRVEAGSVGDTEEVGGVTLVPVELRVDTVAFGSVEEQLRLPFADGGIDWDESLTFPGLRSAEHLENRIDLAPRAPILAGDGTALAEGPAEAREHPLGSEAIDVTGELGTVELQTEEEASEEEVEAAEAEVAELARHGFPPGTPVGVSGLEQAFNDRLAGRPGGSLLAVASDGSAARILAEAEPRKGAAVKTTIDPDLQSAAVASLAGRSGGVVALDARSGDIRAVAGLAFSAPQPPGSTFKMVTTTAALQKGVVSLEDEFEIVDGVNVGGRFISNANGEFCGGTFREAFAESCNADFAPLGPEIGNDEMVEVAERFGFNSPPPLYAPKYLGMVDLPESSIPTDIGEEVDLGVTAIGQGEVLATPLEMATVAQTIANGGVRAPTSIVANQKLRPHIEPVRVMSGKIAAEITELMVGVVTEGTGTAGAIAEAQVAGKTGTSELGPVPGQENEPEPEQIKDAWFAAFAPAEKPRLAVGVMLIEAEAAGGEVAAPIASEVLSAGL